MDVLQRAASGWVARARYLFATLVALFAVVVILPGTCTQFVCDWSFGDTTIGVGLSRGSSKFAALVGLDLRA